MLSGQTLRCALLTWKHIISCIPKLQKKSIFICLNIKTELKKMIFRLTWCLTFACSFVSPIPQKVFLVKRMLNSLYPIILDQWGLYTQISMHITSTFCVHENRAQSVDFLAIPFRSHCVEACWADASGQPS